MKLLNNEHSEIKIHIAFGENVVAKLDLLLQNFTLQRINISHLPAGLYFVRLGNYTEKFVVVK